MGFWSTVGRVGAGLSTFGLSEVANEATGGGVFSGGESGRLSNLIKDPLFGKKDPGRPDKMIELDPSLRQTVEQGRAGQQQGLGLYSDELRRLQGTSPETLSQIVQARKEKGIIGEGKDAKRRAQQLVAQRGLNKSSVGLNAMLQAGSKTGEKIQTARANQPLMTEQIASQRMGQIGQATGGINQVLNAQGAQRDLVQGRQGGQRSGGLLGLLGGAVGAYASGSNGGDPFKGFQAGQGLGTGLSNL